MSIPSIYQAHEWCILETEFKTENQQIAESIFSIGNGHMGQRANFEEEYSGETLQGNYIGGVFFPDKTRVGWWKNGYPDYFAKVLNSPTWIQIHITANGEKVDLAKAKVSQFTRVLNMQEGTLARVCTLELKSGLQLQIQALRFVSMVDTEIGVIEYKVTAINKDVELIISSKITSDVKNEDSNYGETFWESVSQAAKAKQAVLLDKTKQSPYNVPVFTLATAMTNVVKTNSNEIDGEFSFNEKTISEKFELVIEKGETVTIEKFATQVSSLNYAEDKLEETAKERIKQAKAKGIATLLKEHKAAWLKKWEISDVIIKGDIKAQQGIRFNIFQLQQTYTGADSRLNIGPKGFSGEKYGGATYWDTEAFCLPFYLATSPEEVSRNLLIYRHKQLPQAIANAAKLGFAKGAALYPMVTMTGDECHNEWEITFEEIHRNGAIAYAIYNYVNYTDDKAYLVEYGLEVLIAISRFWAQRITFSQLKKKYVMLGVTGPNEYENNVNNNWFTNYFAKWCLEYTLETISWMKRVSAQDYENIKSKIAFDESLEIIRWTDITKNIHLPKSEEYGLILQQDGYLDKEIKTTSEIDPSERPINQHWSWDRILRSCFIKQADVVQGLYVFEEDFELETIRRNFDFYEARCVHESSLSPCIHSVVASKLNNIDKAYDLYLRTARLDLDDYNKEAHEGLHITSMSGAWLAIVQGFAGMRVRKGKIIFNPIIPQQWQGYSFNITYRGSKIKIEINEQIKISLESGAPVQVLLYKETLVLKESSPIIAKIQDKNE